MSEPLRCPLCSTPSPKVQSTIPQGESVDRYRVCAHCGNRWKTVEDVAPLEEQPQRRRKGKGKKK